MKIRRGGYYTGFSTVDTPAHTVNGQTPEDKTLEKSGHWDKTPEFIFKRGGDGQNPRHFLHLLFMDVILFKIVKPYHLSLL